jgi:hypothetical protein
MCTTGINDTGGKLATGINETDYPRVKNDFTIKTLKA